MYDILFENATVLAPDFSGVLRNRVVGITGDKITLVRPMADWHADIEAAERIDATDMLVMPGLVDCHMHTGQQLLRGRVLDSLPMVWTRIMLPFESTLTPELMTLSAELAALEMIKSGTVAFVDAGSYFMDRACDVYLQSGLRGVLSCSTMDEPGLPESIAMTTERAIEQADELYDAYNGRGLLRIAYALRALMSCSTELIEGTAEHAYSRGAMLQAHMNEYPAEVNYTLQRFGIRPFEYLDQLHVLSEDFLAAHCLMLSEEEKSLIVDHGVKVCHCPFSNCAKAVPEAPSLRSRGIIEGLGSDGAAHGGLSLWSEMHLFRSIMNLTHGIQIASPTIMPADQVVRMATENGFKFMGVTDAGRVEEGARADLITVSLRNYAMYPSGNIVNSLVECATASDVRDMVVNGKMVMRDREVLTLDEKAILAKADRYQEELNKL